jgi:SAM-dependent methyltransferase
MPTLIPFPNLIEAETTRAAYDALAPAYDALTAGDDYDARLDAVEALVRRHGHAGERVLDVACGTGRGLLALLERGYAVTACDGSAEMVRRATAKAPQVPVVMADMRALPQLGRYDLVTCLGWAFNCLLHSDDLCAALRSIARSLEPDGLAVWDANPLERVRACFAEDWIADRGGWFIAWHGTAAPDVGPGAIVEARVDAFHHRAGVWERTSARLKHRHWPGPEITRHARAAGLRVLEIDEARGLFVAAGSQRVMAR